MAYFCYEYLEANELELIAEYTKIKEGALQRLELDRPSESESEFWVARIEVTFLEPWMNGREKTFTFAITWLNEILDFTAYHCPITKARWREPIRVWLNALRKNLP